MRIERQQSSPPADALFRSSDADPRAVAGGHVRDFVSICVRIPKSGSQSMARLLGQAFAGYRTFYLPDTLHLDGEISAFQRLRFRRSRLRNLLERYGTADIDKATADIAARSAHGDLVAGGHIDFPFVRARIPQRLKIVTILREPADRCRSDYNYAREVFLGRGRVRRFTAAILPKAAGRHDFDGFLDFLDDHRATYGNVACRFLGWDRREDLGAFFARNVFHSGILEEKDRYARDLGEKTGTKLTFPHENRTRQAAAQAVSGRQRRKIEKIFEHDLALYEWQRAHL